MTSMIDQLRDAPVTAAVAAILPNPATTDRSMAPICRMALLFLLALALPARAADVVYPTGSRIGLAPPSGMAASRDFPGFEDRGKNATILVAALPAPAYAELEKSDTADALRRQGATLETREELMLPAGKGILVIGSSPGVGAAPLRTWLLALQRPDLTALITARIPDSAKDAYPDTALRAALSSVAVRSEVPVSEQLALLPFQVGDLAGFKIGGVLAGRAVILTDADQDAAARTVVPHIIVALGAGAAPEADDRGDFARKMFESIPNLQDARVTAAEPLRIGGQPGHEIMANAKDPATGTDITLVQWIRFGGAGYLHLIGVAPAATWTAAYERFRAVRDGIGSK